MQVLDYKDFPRGITHDKIYCFDVDDTILHTTNRDYENSVPKKDMIDKINQLYDFGFGIVLFTARGQLSKNGNLDIIEEKNRPVLENWLEKHAVKYDKLLFCKPLACCYVDDKAIRPDEFLNLDIRELEGGSGSEIYKEGSRVVKTCSNAIDQEAWYLDFSVLFPHTEDSCLSIPRLHSRVDKTLYMDYVGTDSFTANPTDVLPQLFSFIRLSSEMQNPNPEDYGKFDTYIERIDSHLSNFRDQTFHSQILGLLTDHEDDFNEHISFCHGDLTLSNVRVSDSTVYLIDPNRPKGLYSSYLLDISKLMQSIIYGYEKSFGISTLDYDLSLWSSCFRRIFRVVADVDNFIPKGDRSRVLSLCHLLLITHYIRMYKYKPEHQKHLVLETIKKALNDFDRMDWRI